MTNQERLIWIFEDDIARRCELVRISEVAIGLHEDRIAVHRQIVATETAEIERLERAINARRRVAKPKAFSRKPAEASA